MAYVTPIKDRVLSDATTPTSKGLWNVADWTRVYNNAQLVNSLIIIELGTPVAFTLIALPTITTIPSVTTHNTLLSNIETMRAAMVALIPSLVIVKYDWVAGNAEDAPDYTDANLWETTIDAIWDYYSGDGLAVCSTLAADLTIADTETVIVVDCIKPGEFSIFFEGTGTLYAI